MAITHPCLCTTGMLTPENNTPGKLAMAEENLAIAEIAVPISHLSGCKKLFISSPRQVHREEQNTWNIGNYKGVLQKCP